MKLAINVIALIVCGVLLFIGHQHWKEKLSAYAKSVEEYDGNIQAAEGTAEVDVALYTKGVPSFLAERIKQAAESKKPLRFVIVESGSKAPAGETWAVKLKEQLEKTYGRDIFHIQIQSYPGQTTIDLRKNEMVDKLSAFAPDMILFEPPMIVDNGVVGLSNTLQHLTFIIDGLKEKQSHIIFMMQPPNPIYGAQVYPLEVAELKKFAAGKKIYYIDHWQAWPAGNSPELLTYLEENRRFPNEKGHELWAKAITPTFLSSPSNESHINGQ